MAISKKFYEEASKNDALRAEVEEAMSEALYGLLEENGLEGAARKAAIKAAERVAAAHGFEAETVETLDLGELDAAAGGICYCPFLGGGTDTGKQCFCFGGGFGKNDSGKSCDCPGFGTGYDDE